MSSEFWYTKPRNSEHLMELLKLSLSFVHLWAASNQPLKATCAKTAAPTWHTAAIWTLLLFWPTVARSGQLDAALRWMKLRTTILLPRFDQSWRLPAKNASVLLDIQTGPRICGRYFRRTHFRSQNNWAWHYWPYTIGQIFQKTQLTSEHDWHRTQLATKNMEIS